MEDYDEDAYLELSLADGSRMELNRYNTTLFTFIGTNAMYNHVFIKTQDEEEDSGTIYGTYVFHENNAYAQITAFMVNNWFPMRLNANEVPQCDRNAYENAIIRDSGELPDYIPDSWEDEK